MLREMKVAGLVMDPQTNTPIVVLKDLHSEASLPIWIGLLEPRPLQRNWRKSIPASYDSRPHDELPGSFQDPYRTNRGMRSSEQYLLRAHLPAGERRDQHPRCTAQRRDRHRLEGQCSHLCDRRRFSPSLRRSRQRGRRSSTRRTKINGRRFSTIWIRTPSANTRCRSVGLPGFQEESCSIPV